MSLDDTATASSALTPAMATEQAAPGAPDLDALVAQARADVRSQVAGQLGPGYALTTGPDGSFSFLNVGINDGSAGTPDLAGLLAHATADVSSKLAAQLGPAYTVETGPDGPIRIIVYADYLRYGTSPA